MARVSDGQALEAETACGIGVALHSAIWDEHRGSGPVVLADGIGRFVLNAIQLEDGRKMSFLHQVCEKENAPTIVFVHGFPLDHKMWLGQMPLSDEATLLIPDLPGFGQSDPAGDGLSMKGMADDVAQLLETLGVSKVIWCGLSMGGYVGWEFIRNHREMLAGLICCNTRATADDEATVRARRFAASQVVKTGARPVADAMRGKLFANSTIAERPDVVESIVDTICKTAPETIAAAQIAMSRRTDFSTELGTIDVPTLVVAGDCDSIAPPSEMQLMSMEISAATFVELSETGHMSPLERSQGFNRAVTHWLSR